MFRLDRSGRERLRGIIVPLRKRAILASGILVIAALTLLSLKPGQVIPAAIKKTTRAASTSGTGHPQSSDDLRRLVLGAWEDDYQGSRKLTVRADGTATMIVEFDGWKARMFTPRLELETTWVIEAGRFNRQTVGGEPADKVEFVKKRVGDRASDKIVKVTADRMILIDQDGETRYEWRRVSN